MSCRLRRILAGLLCMIPLAGTADTAALLAGLEYRNLGPYRVGAWVSDFAVPENGREHLYTWYVAMRSGGLWKTVNNGTTFEPVFDGNGMQAIGAVAVAPSDNDIVWVGTGDNANARSSRPGIGVFRSDDGGRTWQSMGLENTQHIARIVIHPTDPDTVYVAAIGHLFSSNPERGLYRTRDGGETWQKLLYIADNVGVVDVALDRHDPDHLLAASYEFERRPWHFEAGGAGSGIHYSDDGGDSWTRVTAGLPDGPLGRIGLDLYRRDGNFAYAVVENLQERPATDAEARADRDAGREPAARIQGGEVYRSDDGGLSWARTHDDDYEIGGKAPYSFNQLFIDPNDADRIFVTSVYLASSEDGGRTWRDLDQPETLFRNNFGDVRTFWIDPEDSERMLFGSDGGVYVSYDGGRTSDHLYNLPTGEIYAVGIDQADPYNIYLGLQDHESWKGPVNSFSGAVTLEDWVLVGLWDGMYNVVDPRDNRYLYTTAQFGGHRRVDQANGTRSDVQPDDRVFGEKPRFPWTPAIVISPHDADTVYAGAQRVLRSTNRGETWVAISDDLTHGKSVDEGGRCVDAGGRQGWINFCAVTTLDESALREGLLWAGTDDGRVHVSEDGGSRWRDLTPALARDGASADYWVSRARASRHAPGTAYITKTGLRFDRFDPQVWRTTDYGESWHSIAANLPASPVNVIWEDHVDPDLLFVGNERGVWFTLDGGQAWQSLRGNMPVVPVTDLVVHPREHDLVVATYGRGAWVADMALLRELAAALDSGDAWLFDITDNVLAHSERANWGAYHMKGDRHLATANEPAGLVVRYYLPRPSPLTLTVHGPAGKELERVDLAGEAGLSRFEWTPPADAVTGRYRVTLRLAGRAIEKFASLRAPRAFAIGPAAGEAIP